MIRKGDKQRRKKSGEDACVAHVDRLDWMPSVPACHPAPTWSVGVSHTHVSEDMFARFACSLARENFKRFTTN